MARKLFQVRAVESVRILEISLPQTVDATDLDRLNADLPDVVHDHKATGWVVDLTDAEYVGSALLGTLVNFRHMLLDKDIPLVLCGLSPVLQSVFNASSLNKLFVVCGSTEDAVQRVGR